MKLTEHFSLAEMIVSPTAKRLGLSNTPTPEHIENMPLVVSLNNQIDYQS